MLPLIRHVPGSYRNKWISIIIHSGRTDFPTQSFGDYLMNKYSVTAACTHILALGLSNSVPTSLDISYNLYFLSDKICGPGSSVGIATELRNERFGIESRWRRDFPPFQTGPGAHPASCTMGLISFDSSLHGHPMIKSRIQATFRISRYL